jgi:hypothetical protein
MPKWLRWIFITCENIPLIEVLPVNSIMLGLSYLDNRDTVKLVKEKAESLAKRQDVKIIRSYVSDRISGSSS